MYQKGTSVLKYVGGNRQKMGNHKIDPGLFESAVRFHIKNLNRGVSCENVKDGVMYFRGEDHKEIPVQAGDENGQHWNEGLLFFFNGTDIVSQMRKVGMIPKGSWQNYKKVDDIPDFFKYVSDLEREDGVIVYDRLSKAYSHINKVDENAAAVRSIEGGLERLLPANFITEDCSKPLFEEGKSNIGCRTQAAFKTTRGFDGSDREYRHVYALLIKQTAYNKLGLGTMSYITDDTLDMFSFRHIAAGNSKYIDNKNKIAGVHKKYELRNGVYTQMAEDLVHINAEGRLAYNNEELVFKRNGHEKKIYPVPNKRVLENAVLVH
jgi:hypothetical protein